MQRGQSVEGKGTTSTNVMILRLHNWRGSRNHTVRLTLPFDCSFFSLSSSQPLFFVRYPPMSYTPLAAGPVDLFKPTRAVAAIVRDAAALRHFARSPWPTPAAPHIESRMKARCKRITDELIRMLGGCRHSSFNALPASASNRGRKNRWRPWPPA